MILEIACSLIFCLRRNALTDGPQCQVVIHILESKFQKEVKKDVEDMLPGAIVIKNDPNYIQGIPDLLILYKDRWAMLEVKDSEKAKHRPNQDYYVDLLGNMSFASFIYPENKEAVLHELYRALRAGWSTRLPQRK